VSRVADLYDRLGGFDAITAVVDSFVARCAADDRINRKFARTDVLWLQKMLVDQVSRRPAARAPIRGATCARPTTAWV